MKSLEMQSQIIQKIIVSLKRFNELSIYQGILIDEYPEPESINEFIGYGPLMSYTSAVVRLKKRLENEGQIASKFGICFDIREDQEGKYKMIYVFDYLTSHEDISSKELAMTKYMRCIHKGKPHLSIKPSRNSLIMLKSIIYYLATRHFMSPYLITGNL
ncbi:hypothetical protein EZV73_20705 [Acidaminobacter sp. JC074]|uniref:hypothetical protein n=1 Tax=Acidaminobacter sp. JC074 TaxID=2530199 RepID=UPI001F1139E9|nr:hypothetical protein [Acidaminobacter sp. JC074]MCH4890012.1 hypothetical protein [Acidaminobacter sp. JC074]